MPDVVSRASLAWQCSSPSALRLDLRHFHVFAPGLLILDEERLRLVRRENEWVAAELIEKLFGLLGTDDVHHPFVELVDDRPRRCDRDMHAPPRREVHAG